MSFNILPYTWVFTSYHLLHKTFTLCYVILIPVFVNQSLHYLCLFTSWLVIQVLYPLITLTLCLITSWLVKIGLSIFGPLCYSNLHNLPLKVYTGSSIVLNDPSFPGAISVDELNEPWIRITCGISIRHCITTCRAIHHIPVVSWSSLYPKVCYMWINFNLEFCL